jgi:hypothetical protein
MEFAVVHGCLHHLGDQAIDFFEALSACRKEPVQRVGAGLENVRAARGIRDCLAFEWLKQLLVRIGQEFANGFPVLTDPIGPFVAFDVDSLDSGSGDDRDLSKSPVGNIPPSAGPLPFAPLEVSKPLFTKKSSKAGR